MKYFLHLVLSLILVQAYGQEKKIDPTAVAVMDKMSSVIGELQSCSFTLSSSVDKEIYSSGWVTEVGTSKVKMVGPDKMLVHTRQSDHHKGYWYDGDSVTYYSFDENNYVKIPAPGNIISMIDSLKHTYQIDFPASDFFYPTFTDDVIDHFEQIYFVGEEKYKDQDCFHIKAENDDLLVQFWIADDAYNLPLRFSIRYKSKKGMPVYEADFSDWELNPDLPESIFSFHPPANARLIAILSTIAD